MRLQTSLLLLSIPVIVATAGHPAAGELPDTPDTLLLLRFDGDGVGVGGEEPAASAGTSYVSGLVGDAVQTGVPGYVRYATTDNIDAGQGTIEFWLRPNWDGDQDTIPRAFFEVGENFDDGLLLSIDGANNLRFIRWGDDPDTPTIEHHVERGLAASAADATAGTWYHIAATWDDATREMLLYVDGALVAYRLDGVQIAGLSTALMTVGAESNGASPADASFDELRISNRALTPDEILTDFYAGIGAYDPPTYAILRGEAPVGLSPVGEFSLPWTDPEPVLLPGAPDLLQYRIDGLSRLHIMKTEDSVALYTAWPSEESQANSDEWIVDHHDGIGLMQPRLLVLNFSNDTPVEQVDEIVEGLIHAVEESTRWHGYDTGGSPPFLEYSVEKRVDLRDDPPVPTCDGNSTRYPRRDGTYNFEYSELYGDTFAAYYGYVDPDDPGRFLTLGELVERGIVHELWFIANHGACGAPLETVELKQYYDLAFRKTGYGPAGNGHDYGIPWIGRSLRITFINPDRGTGCAMENLGHGWEGYANYAPIPYLAPYLIEYAGFDLNNRWGLPFPSFYYYGSADSNAFPDPSTLVAHYQGQDWTLYDYVAAGGNVHFPPNGRRHYDLSNPDPVMSTIRGWRGHEGPAGEDLAEPFHVADFADYYEIAPDCMGPWIVYWRQNMPGLGNDAHADGDVPMKNWWPFLFY
jgi:hypothetical protein